MKWTTEKEEMVYLRTQRDADIEIIGVLREQLAKLRAENASLKKMMVRYRPTESAVDAEPPQVSPETANKFMDETIDVKAESLFVIPVVDLGKGKED